MKTLSEELREPCPADVRELLAPVIAFAFGVAVGVLSLMIALAMGDV